MENLIIAWIVAGTFALAVIGACVALGITSRRAVAKVGRDPITGKFVGRDGSRSPKRRKRVMAVTPRFAAARIVEIDEA